MVNPRTNCYQGTCFLENWCGGKPSRTNWRMYELRIYSKKQKRVTVQPLEVLVSLRGATATKQS